MTAYVCCASFVCLLSLILVTSARPKIAAYSYRLANLIKGICLKENILEPAFQHNSEFYYIVVAHGRLCPDIFRAWVGGYADNDTNMDLCYCPKHKH